MSHWFQVSPTSASGLHPGLAAEWRLAIFLGGQHGIEEGGRTTTELPR